LKLIFQKSSTDQQGVSESDDLSGLIGSISHNDLNSLYDLDSLFDLKIAKNDSAVVVSLASATLKASYSRIDQ
jgi:hypothetical protein